MKEDVEEWFTLEDIVESDNEDTLYCISVDAPEKQFLIGDKINAPTHNTDEGKLEDELKGEASLILGSIARLGRAAGVHLAIATQRPDATLISGETKANLGARVCCGPVNGTASGMILDSGEGTRIRPAPRGRIYVKIFTHGNHAQGFFAPDGWMDKYFESQGMNPDGTFKTEKKASRLANITDISKFEDADLDEMEGVDNNSIIEQMRQAEEAGIPYDDQFEEEEEDDSQKADDDRPKLTGESKSKTRRHEDDWDSAMDSIVEANKGD